MNKFTMTCCCFIALLFLPSLAQSAAMIDQQQLNLKTIEQQRQGLAYMVNTLRQQPLLAIDTHGSKQIITQSQRDHVKSIWGGFTDHLIALELLETSTANFLLKDSAVRQKEFYQHYAAFLTLFRYALDFIQVVEQNPDLATLLNEEQATLGLQKNSYKRFKLHYLNAAIAARFASLEVLYQSAKSQPPQALIEGINQDRDIIWQYGKGKGLALTVQNAQKIISDGITSTFFPVQKGVANWMGNVRVRRNGKPLITPQQINAMPAIMQPGDILLERREWYLTNIGIPGFWPHAALYIGTAEQREQYFNQADVIAWVKQKGIASGDFEELLATSTGNAYETSLQPESGHTVRVVEAIAAGVSFTSLEHSAAADSLAALRPRLNKVEIAKAILKAFNYAGRPYDYNFDFMSDASLVCSELIYKSYQADDQQQGLQLPLKSMAGRLLMPANAIAQQYDETFNSESQQFDMVLFLDGKEFKNRAEQATEEDFRQSWQRPKWHILTDASN